MNKRLWSHQMLQNIETPPTDEQINITFVVKEDGEIPSEPEIECVVDKVSINF